MSFFNLYICKFILFDYLFYKLTLICPVILNVNLFLFYYIFHSFLWALVCIKILSMFYYYKVLKRAFTRLNFYLFIFLVLLLIQIWELTPATEMRFTLRTMHVIISSKAFWNTFIKDYIFKLLFMLLLLVLWSRTVHLD